MRMRLINADELMEHVWRDRLDSRELIAEMIEKAPTVKEIPTNIPIDVFEKLISPELKTGHWIKTISENGITSAVRCSECGFEDNRYMLFRYCPNCGAKMFEPQESEG